MAVTNAVPLTGTCLCGRVCYTIDAGGVFDAGYCHCSNCRRASGAPVIAWANVELEAFHLTRGEPTAFALSEQGERAFCPRCGSQLLYRPAEPAAHVSVTVGSLDTPEDPSVMPRVHLFVGEKLCWLALEDELPRYSSNQVAHPDRR